MKTNPDYIFRDIAETTVLVPVGQASQQLNGILQLSDTAAYIWKHINRAEDPEDLVQALMREYDVNEDTARQDVKEFLQEAEELGIIVI